MKNNIYTAIPDWFNKVQSQSTDNTSTTTTQTTIIGGGGSISMSVHNLFIKSDTTITIDDFTISDLFVTDQITDTENWLTTPLLHTLPNTEVSVTTAAQQLYIGAYDKNNNQIKLYQFSEAISTVVIPENCYYLRASSNKANTDLTIKYVGLNNFDETQQNKLESSSFQNFLTLVEGDEKGVITNSVQNLSLVFQNPLYYTLDKAGNVLISIDRDALFSQSENPTDDRYVTTVANSVQDILSSKNFKEGLSINGIEIVERNGFLYIKGNLATTGGITAYTDDPDDPGGSGGLPGGGAIGDIVITGSGNALVDASLSEDHSVITFTKGWLVDVESDQSITGIKDFINGLKLSGQLIKIVDGVLFLDCSIAATGGITAYATMPGEGSSSIMDQLVVDTEYFIITEEGVLTIVPGSVGGISNIYVTGNGNALTTVTLSEDGKTVSFTKDKNFADQAEMSAYKAEVNQTIAEFKNEVNEQLKHFVTLDTEQEITAIKHFIEGVTIGSNKHKFYEKDGVLWLEGDIAITGGITTYATENVDVSTIMDGVVVDEITITKGDNNVLRVKDAGVGSSFDENAMWSALASSSDKQINKSHLTTALTGYATETWVTEKGYITSSALNGYATESWVTSKNYAVKATTLAGYGITDAYTKTESDSKYPTKTGSGASGTWGINITGNAGTATKLQTARTLWGNNFDGTANISGDITLAIGKGIYLSANDERWLLQTKRSDNTQINGIKTNGFQMCTYFGDTKTMQFSNDRIYSYVDFRAQKDLYINGIRLHKTADGVITLEGNLAVTGGVTMYAIDPVSVSTVMDGVVVDGTTIKKENGKLVAVGGGEAGSVAWGNISGKPSVFATNIANITDLHSSWDSVLAAKKPAWLTAVSIATISDLHANWDALLKAAPSAYVTRWPTISEVTGKQNLVVKLNGGTTEGTNQFTYNATGAKTINITPAGIGAAASSHNHSWSNITSGKPTTLAGYGITDAPTKTGGGASGTWAINITGTAGAAHSADSAVKLQNVRRLWGNNFDGTGDVTGQIVAYNGIYLPYGGKISDEYGNILRTNYDGATGYNDYFEITAIGSNKIEKSLIGGNSGLLTWSGNRFIFNSYGVGWYVEDGEWMRTYNNLFVPLKIQCNGNIECGSNITCRTLQANALDIAYGTNYKFVRMSWNGTSGDVASFFVPGSTSQWFTMELRSNGVLYTNGNILATGGGTFYGSDIRYKSIIQQIKLSLLDIAEAPSFVYHWNKEGMKCDRLNLGGSAQYTQTILPWAVEEKDNFLSMDYATVAYTFSVHTARHLLDYETKTDKEIRKLKNRIKYLEKQLKSLRYEEANIVDN